MSEFKQEIQNLNEASTLLSEVDKLLKFKLQKQLEDQIYISPAEKNEVKLIGQIMASQYEDCEVSLESLLDVIEYIAKCIEFV